MPADGNIEDGSPFYKYNKNQQEELRRLAKVVNEGDHDADNEGEIKAPEKNLFRIVLTLLPEKRENIIPCDATHRRILTWTTFNWVSHKPSDQVVKYGRPTM